MFDIVVITKSSGTEPSILDVCSGVSREDGCEEPGVPTKQLEQDKCRDVSSFEVAKEVIQESDPELDSDIDVMCMIFQASEECKPEFDSYQQLTSQNQGIFDPIRRTTSSGPPAITRTRKPFSRTMTAP
jgi:hypothetical protein